MRERNRWLASSLTRPRGRRELPLHPIACACADTGGRRASFLVSGRKIEPASRLGTREGTHTIAELQSFRLEPIQQSFTSARRTLHRSQSARINRSIKVITQLQPRAICTATIYRTLIEVHGPSNTEFGLHPPAGPAGERGGIAHGGSDDALASMAFANEASHDIAPTSLRRLGRSRPDRRRSGSGSRRPAARPGRRDNAVCPNLPMRPIACPAHCIRA